MIGIFILDEIPKVNKQLVLAHSKINDGIRPCDRCWFTSKQIQDWADMDRVTLNRKLEKLVRVGRIIELKEDNTTNNIIDIDNNDITNDGNTEEISSGSNLNLMNYTTNSDSLFGQSIADAETLENTDDFRGNESLPRNNFLKINSNGMKFINESGLYTLIAMSNKPEARSTENYYGKFSN